MFSFKSFALFTTFALGAISSVVAAPVSEATTSSLLARCDCNSAATIVQTLTDDLTYPISQLHFLTASNTTTDTLQPIVDDITGAINTAIGAVHALAGQPVEVILATIDGTAQITVTELAQLVGGLITLVFQALGAVLTVAGGASSGVVAPLLATVGNVLGAFLSALFAVVLPVAGGLVAAVLALVGDVVGVISQLNVSVVVSLLGL